MSDNKKTVVLGSNGPISLALTTGRLILARKKDLDLASPENGIMGSMFVDPIRLAENCWVIYGDRIAKAGIESEEAFYELLDEEGNRALDTAFKNAVSDFFTWGPAYVKSVREAYEGAQEEMEAELDEATERKIDSSSQKEPGETSGNSQESSE